jgi:hypothetical protein
MARSSARPASHRWLPLLGIGALACSVDHRHLRLGSDTNTPTAGTGIDGGDSLVTGENPNPEGGAAGEGQGPVSTGGSPTSGSPSGGGSTSRPLPPLVNGCADLDTDGVADCAVTLVKNPTFKSDVTSWTAVDTATLAWDPRNPLADTPSGSALLAAAGSSDIDGSLPFKAEQCVAVPANQIIIAYANALVDAPSAAGTPAQAELEVSFFDSEDCTGGPTGQFFTPPSPAAAWSTIQAGGLSGPATRSASLALVGLKPYRADQLRVCFDNVMLEAKAPPP